MPRLLSAAIAMIVGYLDGAGLGAVSLDLLARPGPDADARIALVAAVVGGPAGALLALALVLLTSRTSWPAARPQ